jgi:hypothetical protein
MEKVLRAALTGLVLLLAACAGSPGGGGGTGPDAAAELTALPAELLSMRRVGTVTDYRQLTGDAGLGASVRYEPTSGENAIAMVYIYDRGQRRAPEGASSPEVEAELRQATGEILAVLRLGRFRAVKPEAGITVSGPDGLPGIRCAIFRIIQSSGQETGDGVCVTVRRGRFMKVRLTSAISADPLITGVLASSFAMALIDAPATSTGAMPAGAMPAGTKPSGTTPNGTKPAGITVGPSRKL